MIMKCQTGDFHRASIRLSVCPLPGGDAAILGSMGDRRLRSSVTLPCVQMAPSPGFERHHGVRPASTSPGLLRIGARDRRERSPRPFPSIAFGGRTDQSRDVALDEGHNHCRRMRALRHLCGDRPKRRHCAFQGDGGFVFGAPAIGWRMRAYVRRRCRQMRRQTLRVQPAPHNGEHL